MKVLSPKLYLGIWATLLGLLALTVVTYFVNLGWGNTVINLAIAVAKAMLVILFFMHVRYSQKLVWVFSGMAFYWLAIMFTLTLSDVLTRSELPMPGK